MAEHDGVELDSHVHRRRLQAAVRQARIDAGRTQPEVAKALDWSLSKVVRIESGAVGVSITDLKALLDLYGVDDTPRVAAVLADARRARRPASWADYSDVYGKEFIAYLGFESSASEVRQFHATLIPGLLQTEAYARRVFTAVRKGDDVERLVQARLKRQHLLAHVPATFVLDEAAIRRQVGGPDVMIDQLRRLDDVARRANVSIRMLPFTAGEHAGLAGSFVLLAVDEERIAYVEDAEGGLLRRDDVAVTDDYAERFRRLAGLAVPLEPVLGEAIEDLRAAAGSRMADGR